MKRRRSIGYYKKPYLRVISEFRNGFALSWHHLNYRDLPEAVFWSGRRLLGEGGLTDTVVEIWGCEPYTSSFYFPRPKDVVVDIGANVGAFTLWMLQRAACSVLAAEPSPRSYARLRSNLGQWDYPVEARQVAIGGKPGQCVIRETTNRSLDTQVVTLASPGEQSVPMTTLDLFLDSVDHIDFLKMDIEGSEADVFATITDFTLRRISRFAIEYHDNLRPGTLQQILARTANTHSPTRPPAESADGYGILLLQRHPV